MGLLFLVYYRPFCSQKRVFRALIFRNSSINNSQESAFGEQEGL